MCVCVCVCVCWRWDRHLSPHQQAILQISARSYNSTQFWHSLPGEITSDSIGSRLNPTRSPPAPPKEGKPWEALVKFRVQEHQLTGRPRPNHRTLECHSSQNLPLPHERPLYQDPFYTVWHICLLTPDESKHDDGAKKGVTQENKRNIENYTKIWMENNIESIATSAPAPPAPQGHTARWH